MTARPLEPSRLRILDWSSLRAHLIWVYGGPPEVYRADADEGGELKAWLIQQGRVVVRTGDGAVAARAGSWVVLPRRPYRQEFSRDAQILSVRFHASWPNGENLVRADQPQAFQAADLPRMKTAAEAMERMVRRHFPSSKTGLLLQNADFPLFFRLQRLFLDWIESFGAAIAAKGLLLLPAARADPRVLEAAQRIDRHFHGQPFSTAAVARPCGLSASQLDRLFARHLRLTPRRYFEQRRLEAAREMLAGTSTPIKEIGYRLGFRQPSHFSAWFRRQVLDSPRAFRARLARSRGTPWDRS